MPSGQLVPVEEVFLLLKPFETPLLNPTRYLLQLLGFVDVISLVLGPPGGLVGVELGDQALHFRLNHLLLV